MAHPHCASELCDHWCVCGTKRRGKILGAYDAKSSRACFPCAAKSKKPREMTENPPYVRFAR
eukprot:5323783-Prymnesium_polylepis.1